MPTAYALLHEENGTFGVSFPDFPGCVSTGSTREEAIRKGGEALTFHVAGMVEDNEPLPILRNLPQLRQDDAYREDTAGAAVVMIQFKQPE